MYFTNYRPFANHYYERNNIGFCLFRNLFSLSFPICSQIYYFCKLIINRLSTIESHPLWVRGLKQLLPLSDLLTSCVAPLVSAWIETTMGNGKGFMDRHRPFRGCGLKYKRNHRLADNSALHFSTKTS